MGNADLIRFAPIPTVRARHRTVLEPYVQAIAANPGKAVVVPLNGLLIADVRASLYTLLKRKGQRVHVYKGDPAKSECLAWVDRR